MCIYGVFITLTMLTVTIWGYMVSPRPFFKVPGVENSEKPNLGISITQLLFVIYIDICL